MHPIGSALELSIPAIWMHIVYNLQIIAKIIAPIWHSPPTRVTGTRTFHAKYFTVYRVGKGSLQLNCNAGVLGLRHVLVAHSRSLTNSAASLQHNLDAPEACTDHVKQLPQKA
jgi:hypothetical protein